MIRKQLLGPCTAILASCLIFLSVGINAAKYETVEPIEVTVDASDGSVELVGYLYLPNAARFPDPPLVVLLHEIARTHAVWEDFAQELTREGFAAFAMDMRGYGLSIYDLKRQRNRTPGTFYIGDFERYPQDVRELVDKVFEVGGNRLDTSKVAVIGAAVGANTALLYAVDDPRVQYVGMISPGMEHNGLCVAPALRDYGTRPLYIATAAKDIYSLESCYLISDLSDRVLDMEVYETYFHGSQLLNSSDQLREKLITDLKRHTRL